MSSTILTNSGRYFYFDRPEDHEFTVAEIAHALSQLCRYTGHTQRFYSVAQHSVLVSLVVPPEYAMEALLHDAAEAYLGDVSSPLKRLLPDYKAIERRVEQAITAQFNLPFPLSPIVKQADLRLLMTEKRDLLIKPVVNDDVRWGAVNIEPLPETIHPLSPEGARMAFMRRFSQIMLAEMVRCGV